MKEIAVTPENLNTAFEAFFSSSESAGFHVWIPKNSCVLVIEKGRDMNFTRIEKTKSLHLTFLDVGEENEDVELGVVVYSEKDNPFEKHKVGTRFPVGEVGNYEEETERIDSIGSVMHVGVSTDMAGQNKMCKLIGAIVKVVSDQDSIDYEQAKSMFSKIHIILSVKGAIEKVLNNERPDRELKRILVG